MPKACYVPDGTPSPTDGVCNQQAESSHCCGWDQVCLDNGYCWGGNQFGNLITRGSCTDKTWKSESCPQYCADLATWTGISLQATTDDNIRSFCCSATYNTTTGTCGFSTQGSNKPFLVQNGHVIYNRTSGSTGPNSTLPQSQSTVTVTAVAAGNGTTGHHGGKSGVAIGAGLGVSFGVLLLIAVGLLGLQWKRRRGVEHRIAELENTQRELERLLEEKHMMSSDTRGMGTGAHEQMIPPPRHELDSSRGRAHELNGGSRPPELVGH